MNRFSLQSIIVTILVFCSSFIFSEGFVAGTLVKTSTGYTPIEQLCVGDLVICFDGNNNCVERPIINVLRMYAAGYARIYIEDECISISIEQQMYDVQLQKWITIVDSKKNTSLLRYNFRSCCIKKIEWVDELTEVYCLTIADHHNFFVSKAEVCVHNFPQIVIGLAWAFGGGAIEWLGASLGIAGLGGLYYAFGKKSEGGVSLNVVPSGSYLMPGDPEDEDEKKRRRDEARENYRSLSNKEAEDIAKEFGHRRVKNHPCGNTRNRPVFTNGKNYISPDADGHIGGAWKVFSRKGKLLYTMSVRFERILKIY